jgi:hypothetical protein
VPAGSSGSKSGLIFACCGQFYLVAVTIETVFGVKVLRKLQLKDQEIALKDGPFVSEYESA